VFISGDLFCHHGYAVVNLSLVIFDVEVVSASADVWLLIVGCQSVSRDTSGRCHLTCLEYAGDSTLYVGTSSGHVSAWDTRQNTCFMHWQADTDGTHEIGLTLFSVHRCGDRNCNSAASSSLHWEEMSNYSSICTICSNISSNYNLSFLLVLSGL